MNIPKQPTTPKMPNKQKKLLTASEAREMVKTYPDDDEIEKINAEIKKACDAGKYTACFEGHVSEQTKGQLRVNGFEVTCGFQYNEAYTTIKWR